MTSCFKITDYFLYRKEKGNRCEKYGYFADNLIV